MLPAVKRLSMVLIIISVWNCGGHKKPVPVERHIEDPRKGEKLFKEVGCLTCHSMTGGQTYGPQLRTILDKKVEVIRNGKRVTVTVDRDYLLRSLKDPEFEKVNGYQKRKMPVLNLSQENIEYLVDYLMSINKNLSTDTLSGK